MRTTLKQSFFDKYGENFNPKWVSTKESRIHFCEVVLEETQQNLTSFLRKESYAREMHGCYGKAYDKCVEYLKEQIKFAEENLTEAKKKRMKEE